MQFTSKFILLAIALAYGSTAVSAVPIGEYEDLDAREIDDMELFVRDPFSLFGFGTPRASSTPSREVDNPHRDTGAALSVSPFEPLKSLNCLTIFSLAIEDKVRNLF